MKLVSDCCALVQTPVELDTSCVAPTFGFCVACKGRAAKVRTGRRQRFASAVGGYADCLPVLSLRARRRTHSAHFVRLRSNMRRQVSLRSALRARARSLPLLSAEEAHCHLPGRAFAAPSQVFPESATHGSARGGRYPAGAISGATSSAGLGSARLRASITDSPRLLERNERSEWSEFCGATPRRAAQCSRHGPRRGPFVALRRPPLHEPLPGAACPEPRQHKQEAVDSNGRGKTIHVNWTNLR